MKAWLLLGTVVGATVVSDLLQSLEMKHVGEITDFGPTGIGRFLRQLSQRWMLGAAVFCMAISFFAFMTLVEEADLSFAVPASAASVVFETILARIILGESVDWRRWLGAALVAAGVYFLAA